VFLFLDRWNKDDILSIDHDQHHLTRIPPLVRMDQNILEPAFLHRENDLLERDAAAGLQALVLIRVPPERLHAGSLPGRVPFVIRWPSDCRSRATFGVRRDRP